MLFVMFGYRARKHLATTDQEFVRFAPTEIDVDTARRYVALGRKNDFIILAEGKGLESVLTAILESRAKQRLAVFGYFGSGGAKYVNVVPADDFETGSEEAD